MWAHQVIPISFLGQWGPQMGPNGANGTIGLMGLHMGQHEVNGCPIMGPVVMGQ